MAIPTPLAFWNLEDTTDNSGNGKTLTNSASVTFTAGKISNAATTGGTNANYLYIDDAFGLVNTAAYTVSLWLRVTNDPIVDYDIFSKVINGNVGNNGQIARMLYEYNGGARRIRFYQNTTVGTTFFDISGNIGDGTWHHYAIVFSGTAITMYKDNVAAFSAVSNDGKVNTTMTSRVDMLNTQPSGYVAGISGQIDAFGLWGSALSAGVVSELWNGGAGIQFPFTVVTPTLTMMGIGA